MSKTLKELLTEPIDVYRPRPSAEKPPRVGEWFWRFVRQTAAIGAILVICALAIRACILSDRHAWPAGAHGVLEKQTPESEVDRASAVALSSRRVSQARQTLPFDSALAGVERSDLQPTHR